LRYSWFNSDDEGRDFYKTDAKHKELEDQMVKRSSEIWNLDPRKQFDAYFETLKSFPMYGLEDCVQRLGTAIDSKAMPIMLMWGLKDQDVPFESNYDRWLNALQSGSGGQCVQSLEVPDCGHNPLMEDAELVLPVCCLR
jgi:pimeloyl-ACP methyl ester carboxylesterase